MPTKSDVVLVILGVLLAVATYSNMQEARRARDASREALEHMQQVFARTRTVEPQEPIRITLEGHDVAWATTGSFAYGNYAVMDPSCQVHRRQELLPSQVRRESEEVQRVITYNVGTQTWTIPGSGNGGERQPTPHEVWQTAPRVVTHNGVVRAVVTNESITALPDNEKDETNTVKISHR